MKQFCPFLAFAAMFFMISNTALAQAPPADDPYLWLEDIEGEQALNWVREQNAQSEKAITAYPLFEPLKEKYMAAFNDKDKIAYPTVVGDYVYNLWQDKTHERGIWRRMPLTDYNSNKGSWEMVLDIDALSEKEGRKWVFAGASWLAPENKICLISLSDGGKDENEIREFNAETKAFVANGFFFKESKGGVSWIDENKVMVARNFGKGSLSTSGYPRQLKILERGNTLADAATILEVDSTNVGVFGGSTLSDGKRHHYLYNLIAFYNAELYYLENSSPKKLDFPKDASVGGFHKGQLLFALQSDWAVATTTYKAGTLVSMDIKKNLAGEKDIKVVYEPNERSSFVSMDTSKDFIVVNVMENVQNKLIKYTLEDHKWGAEAVDTPEFGSIHLITADNQSNDYFFLYSNFITPRTLYHSDGSQSTVVKKLKDVFKADDLVVEQRNATSADGTAIPYFMVHREDMERNGSNPTLIYAYGGFNNSEQPNYSFTTGLGWLEQGGVYVLANIRGGGEFGPSWHKAALKEKRQNAFDDMYAVSEALIEKKITSPKHLGAFGWSNGGLMAGVLFTQRPDLYNAVAIGAPLLDMKRYNKMLAGASWMGEYGNPDIPEEWEYLKKYSPYHNVLPEKEYPEVFFVTSTKDDRVHPGHARKMAAKMKAMGHPFLYHETIEGGHGAASTTAQQAHMWASIYTYFNMKLKE